MRGTWLPEALKAWPQATRPRPVELGVPLDHPSLYFNKELSILDFIWRVLYQAVDTRHPLLERVRFLAIASYHLDDFFRKRVGGLKRQVDAGITLRSPDGRTPREQLALIREAALVQYGVMTEIWPYLLGPALREAAGVEIVSLEHLAPEVQEEVRRRVHRRVFPVLSPVALESGEALHIPPLEMCVFVVLRRQERLQFAWVALPGRYRWLPVEGDGYRFVALEDVVVEQVGRLFPGMQVEAAFPFRITRNADVRRQEEEAEDLLSVIAEEVRARQVSEIVRLELPSGVALHWKALLEELLEIAPEDTYLSEWRLGLTDLEPLAALDIPEHRYAPWEPVVPPRFRGRRVFEVLSQGEVLVHHPYESFRATVQRFIEEAARDPDVVAIKQTLYRTSEPSPIVLALAEAAQRGKQVTVLVEVKARFEELVNIEWGRLLEDAGALVRYGVAGLKTHAKVALVLREEQGELVPYVHLGTGNYHPETARQYTDLGLFSTDAVLGEDVIRLFHFLTSGYPPEEGYRKILVAPRAMRQRLLELIEEEIAHAQAGKPARIAAKMNGLDDVPLIQALYRASQAGVEVDLVVRGHCRLRPGVPGYSDRIRVRSLIGRFLEHSRIYYFARGGEGLYLIGSADWQRRNLEDRVETLAPVEHTSGREHLARVLEGCWKDNQLAWDLQVDGRYLRAEPAPGEPPWNLQERLMAWALQMKTTP